MESNSWIQTIGDNWRSQIQPDFRQKIVNKIMETLKRYLPTRQENLEGLEKNTAIGIEERLYSAATSKFDYLQKISLQMLTMESKFQNTIPNAIPSNSSGVSRNIQDPVPSQTMQSHVYDQGQFVPLQIAPNQSRTRQPLASNMQNYLASGGMQTLANLPNSLPAVSGLTQMSQIPQQYMYYQKQLQKQLQKLRQQQQPQEVPVIQKTQMPQQQLTGKQENNVGMQQNQLFGQQSNISGMQSLPNLQSQQQTNNHHNLQQQHLVGHQNHVGGLPQQQQMIGSQSGTNGMSTNLVHILQQQSKALWQEQPQHQQCQISASLLQQHIQTHLQSQQTQLEQQLGGRQQKPNALQHNIQQRIQTHNSLLQMQNMIDQQKHLFQSQRAPTEVPLNSTVQMDRTNAGDWQEETYQKIKAIKDLYITDLNEMYLKFSAKYDALPVPQPSKPGQLQMFKHMLEGLMLFLLTPKNNIMPSHRDRLPSYEKQIIFLLNSDQFRKHVPSMPQGKILSPQQQTMQQSQLPNTQSHDSGANPQLQYMNLQGSEMSRLSSSRSNYQYKYQNPIANADSRIEVEMDEVKKELRKLNKKVKILGKGQSIMLMVAVLVFLAIIMMMMLN